MSEEMFSLNQLINESSLKKETKVKKTIIIDEKKEVDDKTTADKKTTTKKKPVVKKTTAKKPPSKKPAAKKGPSPKKIKTIKIDSIKTKSMKKGEDISFSAIPSIQNKKRRPGILDMLEPSNNPSIKEDITKKEKKDTTKKDTTKKETIKEDNISLQDELENNDHKSYGVGIKNNMKENETQSDNLILHIPLKLQSKIHSANDIDMNSPAAYAENINQDNLMTLTNKNMDCDKCYITNDGGVLYCDECTLNFNKDKRDLDRLISSRNEDDDVIKQKDCGEFAIAQISETKMKMDNPPPIYDPSDIEKSDISNFGNSHVKPSSLINRSIDDRNPTRDEYDDLKSAYELLQQRYMKLLKDNHTHNKSPDLKTVSTEGNNMWKERIKIIELMKKAKSKITKAFELPTIFKVGEEWPLKTYTFCMHDAHPFDTPPVPLPLSYNKASDSFRVFGCFCSFQCAFGFKKSNRSLDHIDSSLISFLMNKIQERANNYDHVTVNPAPSPYLLLDIYGGPMDIDQYRSITQHSNLQCQLLGFPLEPVPQFLQVTNQLVNAELDLAFLENEGKLNDKKVKKLKIQRQKPLPNHKNRLESSMGLSYSQSPKII